MMNFRPAALVLGFLTIAGAAVAGPVPAPPAPPASPPTAGPPPNMEPGLWEWTIVQKTNTSFLTPAQIAKLEPDLRDRITASQLRAKEPHTIEACVTADGLRHGFALQHDNNRVCTKQVVSSTPSSIDEHVECRGKADIMKSHITMSVIDRHTIDGSLELQRFITLNGDHQTATGHISGKFETADCGFTKP
jgi:hypothetical protein